MTFCSDTWPLLAAFRVNVSFIPEKGFSEHEYSEWDMLMYCLFLFVIIRLFTPLVPPTARVGLEPGVTDAALVAERERENNGRNPPTTPTNGCKPSRRPQSPVPPKKGERGVLGPGPLADLTPVEGRKEERERELDPLESP